MDEQPIESEQTETAPTEPKGLGSKLVAGAVVAATLIGGVAAAFQLRDYLTGKADSKAKQVAPSVESDGLRRIDAAAGSTIGLPVGWKTVTPEVMEATIPSLSAAMSSLPPGSEVVFLLGPDDPNLIATPFGFVASSPGSDIPEVDALIEQMRGRPDVLLASPFEAGKERGAHILMKSAVQAPDGSEVESRIESYHFKKAGKSWVIGFGVGLRDYLQFSENFQTMARSVQLPE